MVEYENENTKSKSKLNVNSIIEKNGKRNFGILVFLVIAMLIGIPLIRYAVTGSPFGLPPVEDETLHIGYYQIRLIGFNTNGEEYNLTGQVALYNYYTEEYIADIEADGTTIGQTTNVTIGYLYNITDDDYDLKWKNYSFVIFANASQSTPHMNTIILRNVVESGDLSAKIYDLNDVRGEYDVTDFQNGEENNFTLSLTSNNINKTIGSVNYIPIDKRINESISYTALWLEIDKPIESIMIDGFEPSLNITYNDKYYFVMPTFIYGETKDVLISVKFVSDLPTEFKFYDGIPIPEDLILTI
mgnify:CR=1 FL=1